MKYWIIAIHLNLNFSHSKDILADGKSRRDLKFFYKLVFQYICQVNESDYYATMNLHFRLLTFPYLLIMLMKYLFMDLN